VALWVPLSVGSSTPGVDPVAAFIEGPFFDWFFRVLVDIFGFLSFGPARLPAL
jgi:hypothetical protein